MNLSSAHGSARVDEGVIRRITRCVEAMMLSLPQMTLNGELLLLVLCRETSTTSKYNRSNNLVILSCFISSFQ